MTELFWVQLYCKTCSETPSEQMDVSSLNERETMRFAEVRFAIYRLDRVIVYRKVVTLDLSSERISWGSCMVRVLIVLLLQFNLTLKCFQKFLQVPILVVLSFHNR